MRRTSLFLFAALAAATCAHGATNVWIGASGGGDWTDSANWRVTGGSGSATVYDLSSLADAAVVRVGASVSLDGLVLRGASGGVVSLVADGASASFALSPDATFDVGAGRLDCRVPLITAGGVLAKRGAGSLRLFADGATLACDTFCAEGTFELRQGVARDGLRAFWRFENADEIGADATEAAAVPLTAQADTTAPPTLVADGVVGQAVRFGGSQKQGAKLACLTPVAGTLPTGGAPFTFSCWIRPTTSSGRGPNFVHVGRPTSAGSVAWDSGQGFFIGSVMDIYSQPFKALAFYTCSWTRDGKKGHTNEVALAVFDKPLTDGAWHHVVATYADRVISLYVDGTLREALKLKNALNLPSSSGVILSNWAPADGNHKYAGDMDEVQFLRGAWSADDVRAEYAAKTPSVTAPTLRLTGTATVAEGAVFRLAGGTQEVACATGGGRLDLAGGTCLDVLSTNGAALQTLSYSGGGTLRLPERFTFTHSGDPIGVPPLIDAPFGVELPREGRVVLADGAPADALLTLVQARSVDVPDGGARWTVTPTGASAAAFANKDGAFTLRIGSPDTAWTSHGCNLNFASLGTYAYPFLHTLSWNSALGYGSNAPLADGSCSFTIKTGTCVFNGRYTCVRTAANALRATWTLTPTEDISLGDLAVSMRFDRATFAGGRMTLDAKSISLPATFARSELGSSASVSEIRVYDGTSALKVAIAIATPSTVIVQDGREWSIDAYSFRIQPNGTQTFAAGVPVTYDLTFTLPRAVDVCVPKQDVARAGTDWIPMPNFAWPREGTALDFSRLRGTEAPAGKYGRVVRRGSHFEFERLPGVPQRFYGANLVQQAVTPVTGEATYAAGMARLGFNSVRIHHHERYLVQGMTDADPSATTLNPTQLDRFDRLVAACVTNGLYITTDVFVSRSPVSWRSLGFDRDGELETDDFKALVLVHEPTYSNLVAFTRAFFTHVNPYLGRSLADEPAMVGINLVNEGAISKTPSVLTSTYAPWKTAWEAWLAQKKTEDSATYGGVSSAAPSYWTPVFRRFVQERETAFAVRMTRFLRDELGCLAPLTSLNGTTYPAAYMQVRAACYDYADDHYYFDHPSFLETAWQLPSGIKNTNPLLTDTAGTMSLVARRHFGKPYVVTEFNYCGPNRFRGMGGLLAGALGAGQDWDGLWRFAWKHGGTDLAYSSSTMSYFDLAGDPINLASERAAVCLYLRGDLAPFEKAGAMRVRPETVDRPTDTANLGMSLAAQRLAWVARLGHVVSNDVPAGVTSLGAFETARTRSATETAALLGVREDESAVRVDSNAGTLRVATPRTAGGFAPSGTLDAGALTFTLEDAPASVWASSLDGEPLAQSRHVLVTHITEAVNTGMTFDDETRTTLLKIGSLPHQMRRGRAQVRLAMAPGGRYVVHALAADGTPRRLVPASVTPAGVVSFTCDVAAETTATWLYEVTTRGFGVIVR